MWMIYVCERVSNMYVCARACLHMCAVWYLVLSPAAIHSSFLWFFFFILNPISILCHINQVMPGWKGHAVFSSATYDFLQSFCLFVFNFIYLFNLFFIFFNRLVFIWYSCLTVILPLFHMSASVWVHPYMCIRICASVYVHVRCP